MAITLNRNQEISKEDFSKLKKKFRQSTQSKAIYSCVEFVIKNHKRDYLKEIEDLKKELKEVNIKHKNLIKTVKKKFVIDNEFEQILFADS